MSDPGEPSAGYRGRPPYLLYLGNASDELSIKTARGLAYWRAEQCVGQHRRHDCAVDLGLPDLAIERALALGAHSMLIGAVNAGGVMDTQTITDAIAALDAGLHVVSGLHQKLRDQPEIVAAARRNGLTLFDARFAPPGIAVGTGKPRAGRRLLTVGTDCSVGKMYTALALEQSLRRRGQAADFRATGQTGILIAGAGIPIDAVIADFVSGAAEALSPARSDGGWDLIEGQGSLFHPSFAGVSLGLLHGAQPDALVLCHEPPRRHMRGLPEYPLPDLLACMEANLAAARLTNPQVRPVGIALNTSHMDADDAQATCARIGSLFGLPCEDPVRDGVEAIAEHLLASFAG